MNPIEQRKQLLTRRSFLSLSSTCLGAAALNSLMNEKAAGQGSLAGGVSGMPLEAGMATTYPRHASLPLRLGLGNLGLALPEIET